MSDQQKNLSRCWGMSSYTLSPPAELVWRALLKKHRDKYAPMLSRNEDVMIAEDNWYVGLIHERCSPNDLNLKPDSIKSDIPTIEETRIEVADENHKDASNAQCTSPGIDSSANVDCEAQTLGDQPLVPKTTEHLVVPQRQNVEVKLRAVLPATSSNILPIFRQKSGSTDKSGVGYNSMDTTRNNLDKNRFQGRKENRERTETPIFEMSSMASLPKLGTAKGSLSKYFSEPLSTKNKKKHPNYTAEDKLLNAIEQIMKCREACAAPTVTKKPKLMTSQKNDISENHSDPKGTVSFGQEKSDKYKQIPLRAFNSMLPYERGQVESALLGAEEIAMTLVYSDGSSQLRSSEEMGRGKANINPVTLKGVVLIPNPNIQEMTVDHVFFPMKESDKSQRALLRKIMESKMRKLCFRAYQFMVALMKTCWFEDSEVIHWLILDPLVGHWLMDSDHPVKTFSDLLKSIPSISKAWVQNVLGQSETILQDLKLLGPAMAHLYGKLKSAKLWRIFIHLETPLIPVLAAMHIRGLRVDTQELDRMAKVLKCKLSGLEEEAHMAACTRFSLNSHAQLRQILFEDLRLDKKLSPGYKIAKTQIGGQKSTSETVLNQLKKTHRLPAIVLEHRQLQKLKSTYVEGILACTNNGWLHAHWDQVTAATGRLASTQPNIQAVPKQPVSFSMITNPTTGKEPEEVTLFARDPFISKDGYIFLSADFQQVEFRLLAHLSSDPEILKIFTEDGNTDIFVQLTAQWQGKPIDDVTPADREQAKRVVYSVMYGVGKERLADYLMISQDDAKGIIQSFLDRYPGINTFTRSCIEKARKTGFLTTIFGRRRQFPHITHSAHHMRAQAERQAVNFCVQGSAADICKTAMVQMEHALASRNDLDARLLVQIHDELLFEVRMDQIDELAEQARIIMENADALCGSNVKLAVPLTICLAIGKKWGHLSSYTKSKQS